MKKDKNSFPFYEDGWELDDVVSSTECTGLIPTPPASDGDADSYADIYSVAEPEDSYGFGKNFR